MIDVKEVLVVYRVCYFWGNFFGMNRLLVFIVNDKLEL